MISLSEVSCKKCNICDLNTIPLKNSSLSFSIGSTKINPNVQSIEERIIETLDSLNNFRCSQNLEFQIQIETFPFEKKDNSINYSHLFLTRETDMYIDRIFSIPLTMHFDEITNPTLFNLDTLIIRHDKTKQFDFLLNSRHLAVILSKFMEGKDLETHDHNLRVGDMNLYFSELFFHYCVSNNISHEIKTALISNPEYYDSLQIGGIMHDVGKLFIPQEILLKPGRLTSKECDFMKKHTIYGEQILSNLPTMEQSGIISKYHHEKWSGTGYHNLFGKKIPISARITAFTDILDAMVSNRPYKREYSYDEIYDFFYNGKTDLKGGFENHFDPIIAEFAKIHWEEITFHHAGLKKKYPN